MGSTNQKVSSVIDHATSKVHGVAMARKRLEAAKASGRSAVLSSPIGRCLSTLDSTTQARMEKKFGLCFMTAKESIPFSSTQLC